MNISALISSFYVGIDGLDIGLLNYAQGVTGGENRENMFTRYSTVACKIVIKMVNNTISEAMEE